MLMQTLAAVDWSFEIGLIGRMLGAALLGCFMGWERERSGHPAGIRTFAFVTMGSCIMGLVSSYAPGVGETTRISAQVVTGIGFLGAGVILHDQGRVRGLTTAASLWAASAVGLAVAHNLSILGTVAAVVMVILLRVQDTRVWNAITPRAQRKEMERNRRSSDKAVPESARDKFESE